MNVRLCTFMKAFCEEPNAPQQDDNGDGDAMTSGMCLNKTPCVYMVHSFFLLTEPPAVTAGKGLSISSIPRILVLCTLLDFYHDSFLWGLYTDLGDAAEGGNPICRRAAGDKWGCEQWEPCHIYSLPDPVHHSCSGEVLGVSLPLLPSCHHPCHVPSILYLSYIT